MTQYEERIMGLIEQARATSADQAEERLQIALEALALTEDLNGQLRDMSNHVLDTQDQKLSALRVALGEAKT